jgi:HIRAN domain
MHRTAIIQIKAAYAQLQSSSTRARQLTSSTFRLPFTTAPLSFIAKTTSIPTIRLYATRPGASERYMSPMQRVLHSRSQLRSSQPVELLQIVGVSFEGRQEAVSQLEPLQGLAFKKEPENPYDPNAVAVNTLDGISLGYVSKERTEAFTRPICFGQVHSAGQAEGSGMWGCSAEVQPHVPPVIVLPIPANLTGKCHVAELLQGSSEWEARQAEILKRSEGRCSVSGSSTNYVGEQWDVRAKERVFRLLGFSSQAPEVARIAHMLETGEDLKRELAVMNGWSDEDLKRYLKGVEKQRSSTSEEGQWKLDLKVLEKMGVPVPGELLPFVV